MSAMTRPSGVPRCTGPRNFTKSPTFTDYLKFFDNIIVDIFNGTVVKPLDERPSAGSAFDDQSQQRRFSANGQTNQISDFHTNSISGLGGRVKNFFAGDDEIIFIFVEDGEGVAFSKDAARTCRVGVDDR